MLVCPGTRHWLCLGCVHSLVAFSKAAVCEPEGTKRSKWCGWAALDPIAFFPSEQHLVPLKRPAMFAE